MAWSFSLGRIFGSDLKVHVTFFLLLGWIGFSAYATGGPQAAIGSVSFVLALFACVTAHEFGHALMARRYGIRTPDITLLPIGGVARLERLPETPMHEIWVALAGPAVNIAIWSFLVILGAATPSANSAIAETLHSDLLNRLAYINLFLAGFNLIPAFPMDGGRVLRALLCLKLNRVKATRIAAAVGQVMAVGFAVLGFYDANPILVLIAVFVFFAATTENRDVAMRSVTRRVLARDAMITDFHALSSADTLATAAQAVLHSTQHEFPVLTQAGNLKGFITRDRLLSALASDQPRSEPVTLVMNTDIPLVSPTSSLSKVLEGLADGVPAVAVCLNTGQMVGYITRETIAELMVIERQ